MMPDSVSAAFMSLSLLPIWAAAASVAIDAASGSSIIGNESPPIHQFFTHSHKFNMDSRATINSVLSDIKSRSIFQNDEGTSSLLDIDVSSTRLGDKGAASLVEELIPLLKTAFNSVDENQVKAPLLIKLGLATNNISPSGVFNIIDALIKDDVTKEITGRTIPVEIGSDVGIDNSHGLEISSHPDELLGNGLINETAEQSKNIVTSDGLTSSDTLATQIVQKPVVLLEELDLSFNDIGGHGVHLPNPQLQDSVRKLFEGSGSDFVPRLLTLENSCIGPSFCRSVGRGILNSFERNNSGRRPAALHFGSNHDIGDAGTVALAAALKMAVGSESGNRIVLEEIDLSSCNVGDAGAEAVALAIVSNPGCLKQLDLSNNKITDAGATALGRAFVDARRGSGVVFDKIILDNNEGICDGGAAALAEALGCGAVKSVSLRSCSIRAQGAAAFGRALVRLVNHEGSGLFCLDISGNHFGHRKIAKKKGTANLIRDRASTNIKFIGKTLKGAAKRFGSETIGITADSDDDEEVMGGLIDDDAREIDGEKVEACGGHAFAGEIIMNDHPTKKIHSASSLKISVSMRQCLLDNGAIDALSASIIAAKNCELSIDVSMNMIDDAILNELLHPRRDSKVLASMADRHMEYMNRLSDSRERQLEIAKAAATKSQKFGLFFEDEDDDDEDEDIFSDGYFD